jgi:hypothetical protein
MPLKGIAQSFRLAFDLRVDVTDTDVQNIPEVSIAQLLSDGNATSYNYVLGPGPHAYVYAYDTANGGWRVNQELDMPPLRAWTRIVMTYDAAQGMTIIEDLQTKYVGDSSTARGAPGDTDVIVGAVYINPPGSASLQIELDDVVMRGQ